MQNCDTSPDTVRMTEYSHGAGCGCKISPKLLDDILKRSGPTPTFPKLLVGYDTKDDAAVFDLGNGRSVISTTDFFMPIVDDPFEFGQIAATNAISDIYAMGGAPLMAISIFGWPIERLGAAVASRVIEGGRRACTLAGIPLAGGHSIDSPEPIFGLAVTGQVENRYLKRNDQAEAGCALYLTKPLGIGILTTAQKQKQLKPEHRRIGLEAMCQLNSAGTQFAKLAAVKAMTDVTGFGLMGHLTELCQGSNLQAQLTFDAVPLLPEVEHYLALGCTPGGTLRNFESYGHHIGGMSEQQQIILCDPQTSGGLLVAVAPEGEAEFLALTETLGMSLSPIGQLSAPADNRALVEVI